MALVNDGLFSGKVFAFDLGLTVSSKQKNGLMKRLINSGGSISYIVSRKVTHLIITSDKVDSFKCQTAHKYAKHIVQLDTIEECLTSGTITPLQTKVHSKQTTVQTTQQEKEAVMTDPECETCFEQDQVKPWTKEDFEVVKWAVLYKPSTQFVVLELQVQEEDAIFPRYRLEITTVDTADSTHKDQIAMTYYISSGAALEFMHKSVSQLQGQGYTKWFGESSCTDKDISDKLEDHVSPKLRLLLHEQGLLGNNLSVEVCGLIEVLWKESVGEINDIITVPLSSVTTDQVNKAEATLEELKVLLTPSVDTTTTAGIQELSEEFYKHLPHHDKHKVTLDSKKLLIQKFHLCQLLRDVVSVSEATQWNVRPSVQAKYEALRCQLAPLRNTSDEFNKIKSIVERNKAVKFGCLNIYALQRSLEDEIFKKDLDNRHLLLHASDPKNFLGILSRGLLLPKVAVEHGASRRDEGWLGTGIYFTDSFTTSSKYSVTCQDGRHLLLVAEVALGQSKEYTQKDTSLTAPPDIYHSCHGVKNAPHTPSEFQDDEYVIYQTSQQRLKYLIEYTLPSDQPITYPPPTAPRTQDLTSHLSTPDQVTVDELFSLADKRVSALKEIKAGLMTSTDAEVPLKSVHVRANLLDLAASVVVLQEYTNVSASPIEAKYVFPLDEMAVVCGFEAFINGKHIIGEVKEKQTAHKEYREAVRQGHGAYLMDQDEERPDVFTISVGNLPPSATVIIKLTYVSELRLSHEHIVFDIPASVAPWKQENLLGHVTQRQLDTVKVAGPAALSVQVSIKMPFEIKNIGSSSHNIAVKRTECEAVVQMKDDQTLREGFHLDIQLSRIHVPRMWVENHPDKDSQACMLAFYPEFSCSQSDSRREVIFFLDLSYSMQTSLGDAKRVLLLCLHKMADTGLNIHFNVTAFGSQWEEVFVYPQPVGNQTSLAIATDFIQSRQATLRSTELYPALQTYHKLPPGGGRIRNIFIISDGHVNNEGAVIRLVKAMKDCHRVFTLGVSSTVNSHLLSKLARLGGGTMAYFDPSKKSQWLTKVQELIDYSGQPSLTSISVQWRQFGPDTPRQAPTSINSLFNGCRQVVYGFVPNCTMATLVAEVGGQQVSTVVSTTELSSTTGKLLHQLTTKALIQDWEEGVLHEDIMKQEIIKKKLKSEIINLSIEYGIITQFTSFIAVEQRTEGEVFESTAVLDELLRSENVDHLSYISWESSSSSSSSRGSGSSETESEDSESDIALCIGTLSGIKRRRMIDDSPTGQLDNNETLRIKKLAQFGLPGCSLFGAVSGSTDRYNSSSPFKKLQPSSELFGQRKGFGSIGINKPEIEDTRLVITEKVDILGGSLGTAGSTAFSFGSTSTAKFGSFGLADMPNLTRGAQPQQSFSASLFGATSGSMTKSAKFGQPQQSQQSSSLFGQNQDFELLGASKSVGFGQAPTGSSIGQTAQASGGLFGSKSAAWTGFSFGQPTNKDGFGNTQQPMDLTTSQMSDSTFICEGMNILSCCDLEEAESDSFDHVNYDSYHNYVAPSTPPRLPDDAAEPIAIMRDELPYRPPGAAFMAKSCASPPLERTRYSCYSYSPTSTSYSPISYASAAFAPVFASPLVENTQVMRFGRAVHAEVADSCPPPPPPPPCMLAPAPIPQSAVAPRAPRAVAKCAELQMEKAALPPLKSYEQHSYSTSPSDWSPSYFSAECASPPMPPPPLSRVMPHMKAMPPLPRSSAMPPLPDGMPPPPRGMFINLVGAGVKLSMKGASLTTHKPADPDFKKAGLAAPALRERGMLQYSLPEPSRQLHYPIVEMEECNQLPPPDPPSVPDPVKSLRGVEAIKEHLVLPVRQFVHTCSSDGAGPPKMLKPARGMIALNSSPVEHIPMKHLPTPATQLVEDIQSFYTDISLTRVEFVCAASRAPATALPAKTTAPTTVHLQARRRACIRSYSGHAPNDAWQGMLESSDDAGIPSGHAPTSAVWQGTLEWTDNARTPNEVKFTTPVQCHKELDKDDVEIDTSDWPTTLEMQLLPAHELLQSLQPMSQTCHTPLLLLTSGGSEGIDSYQQLCSTVSTDARPTKASLFGCINIPPSVESEVRVVLVLYDSRLMAYVPIDQDGFLLSMQQINTQTAIAEFMTIDSHPDCRVEDGLPCLNEAMLKGIFHIQHEDGYWDFETRPFLESVLKIKWAVCRDALQKAGISSLGQSTVVKINYLLSTVLVLIQLARWLGQDEKNSDLGPVFDELDPGLTSQMCVKKLPNLDLNSEYLQVHINKAQLWIRRTDQALPSIPYRLELGRTWREVSRKWLHVEGHCGYSM